ADARDAFVGHSKDPGNRCPYEAGMRDHQRATGLRMLRQLLQLIDCSCLYFKERLASRRPMMRDEFGPRPCVIWVLMLDFFPRQSFPVAEVHLPKARRSRVIQTEILRDRFRRFSCSP